MMSPRNAAQIQRNSARSTSDLRRSSVNGSAFPIKPIAYAVGLVLLSTGAQAAGPRPFSGGWFNAKGVSQVGVAPGGQPAAAVPGTPPPLAQQQQANKQLQRSIANLGKTASAIAAQQAAMAAARQAALAAGASVPDGLVEGGLKVDRNPATQGWLNADAPTQQAANGRTTVSINQTKDKAILNWETFNVGKNTQVAFQQQKDWAVLNRVNDPKARPSQIQGQIKADGTVLVINRNGVIFTGSSQVNVRNLVAAAANISDGQFQKNGIYSAQSGGDFGPSFTEAMGSIEVHPGAQITTRPASSVTEGGGYVLLLGHEVNNAGVLTAVNGQAALAAGDNFIIRKGVGTAGNQNSSTRGNEVSPRFIADSSAGRVTNSGIISAPTGDITLAGRDIKQDGVLLATSSVDSRGTLHLLNSASDRAGSITLTPRSVSAVLVDANNATALDAQRDALIVNKTGENSYAQNNNDPLTVAGQIFDNLSTLGDRRDLSRVEIVSGGTVEFQGDSLTLATGGQVAVSAARRALVAANADIDVSGAIGVQVAMESNNLNINVQGNEQRDAPINRDGKNLNNSDLWVDRRSLIYVAPGVGGYANARWYTAGGLLEVGGYLSTAGHGYGEWAAQGGTVQLSGGEAITQRDSRINLSGGTLDVQTGVINLSWLRGADGQLHEVSKAPGDLLYTGLYQGFEDLHARWGEKTTRYFYNTLIAPRQRLESGYTTGRDAGRLVVSTDAALLEGNIEAGVYQGPQQNKAPAALADGYKQSQSALARGAQLIVGRYDPVFDVKAGEVFYNLGITQDRVLFDSHQPDIADALGLTAALPEERKATLYLNTDRLNASGLGGVMVAAKEIAVEDALTVRPGGAIELYGGRTAINADLTARGGAIRIDNTLRTLTVATPLVPAQQRNDAIIAGLPANPSQPGIVLAERVRLDARGIWSNQLTDAGAQAGQGLVDGGKVALRLSGEGDIVLGQGSLIDVSSGAAVRVDKTIVGGRGGDVTLLTNNPLLQTDKSFASGSLGQVSLGGELRGYGVSGAGTLKILSGGEVVIDDQPGHSQGFLAAGEAAPDALRLREDLALAQGQSAPFDMSYLSARQHLNAGETIQPGDVVVASSAQPIKVEGGDPNDASTWLVVPPWVVLVTSAGQYLYAGSSVPPGTLVTTIYSPEQLAGYKIPSLYFPQGLPLQPKTIKVKAHDILPEDGVLRKGAWLPAGAVLDISVAVQPALWLEPTRFQTGFAHYDVTGLDGVTVAANTQLNVTRPVYLPADDAWRLPGGLAPEQAMQTWLAPLYLEDPLAAKLTQRAGAGLALHAGDSVASTSANQRPGLAAQVEKGATIGVDPGQSIEIGSLNQLTVQGTLNAWSGSILLNQYKPELQLGASGKANGRSIWIGETARLDVAARAATATDVYGRRYGWVPDGGTIRIGGHLNPETGAAEAVTANAPEAFVVVRPGAVLDASGTQAVLSVTQPAPAENANSPLGGLRLQPDVARPAWNDVRVASNGGSIELVSYHGLYVDGELSARAGGPGAAGGTLAIALEAPEYGTYNVSWDGSMFPNPNVDDRVLAPREMVLAQQQGGSLLAGDLLPGELSDDLAYGTARLGVDRIQVGGFDNLALLSNGVLSFDGDVSLALGKSLQLYAGSLALAETAAADTRVDLSAPYLRLAGPTNLTAKADYFRHFTVLGGTSTRGSQARLHISGDLIDVRDSVTIGAHGDLKGMKDIPGGTAHYDWRGFEETELVSRGDIRFLKSVGLTSKNHTATVTELQAGGNLSLTAAQLYPATHAIANLSAGFIGKIDQFGNSSASYDPDSVLTLNRYGDEPRLPYSAFGMLTLNGGTINQGGILRAPQGQLFIGSGGRVNLLPGSLTSLSAAGLLMPYGGTTDNVHYTYDGKDVALVGMGAFSQLMFNAQSVKVDAGAVLDLSGGGELTGAGFVSGRGGSTDARYTPLVQVGSRGGFRLPGLATNPIYALVPGEQAGYAPVAVEGGAVDPQVGRQIVIGTGVPGLPAGTYTLMPSTYALLPGAFRVEINGLAGQAAANGPRVLRNGSYAVSATLGTVNTALRDALPSEVILTPAALLRQYSQYNEMGYADFARADAIRAGVPRAELLADGKRLGLQLRAGESDRRMFTFDGVGRFAAAEGGYGGTMLLLGDFSGNNRIEVLPEGGRPTEGYLSFYADDLNAINATRMIIGGDYAINYTGADGSHRGANYVRFRGQSTEVALRDGALLAAPEVFLLSTDRISLDPGASINTLGRGKGGFDANDGLIYASDQNNVLAVSNGRLQILPPSSSNRIGDIRIGVCEQGACAVPASLYSEGSIVIAAQDKFSLDPGTRFGTRRLVLAQPNVNVGSERDLSAAGARGVLPPGMQLSQALLDRLLRQDGSVGAPALQELELAAGNSFNFYGSGGLSTLDPATGQSFIDRLILNTPAIYGLGAADDVARIDTGTLVWTGATNEPGAVVNGGAGTGGGALQINAKRIEFGYGPQTQPDTLGEHERLLLGFRDVTLSASERITANNRGGLAVYQRQGDYSAEKGYAYSGGNLHVNTPLLTGEAGSINHLRAGGSLSVTSPAAAGPAGEKNDALGAELSLTAESIDLDTRITLPSGKLTLAASQNIALRDGARIDVAGMAVPFNDITKYSWGGEVVLQSERGDISQAPGAIVDLSAQYNRGGILRAVALGAEAGTLDLRGQILGGASGEYDAGGTYVPYDAGGVELRAQRIEDFAALNRRLNDGAVFGARSFQIKQGSLTIGDEVKARAIDISLDGGSLRVSGVVDASGAQVGSIRLAARDGLTLGSEAVLDARGTALRVDSYGRIIDSPNRATVELNAGNGRLVLQDGALIDLRHGTETATGDGPGQNDGQMRGTLELNAQRLGGAQGDDVAIDAGGSLDIRGARSIAVNGVQRYDDAGYGTDPAAAGRPYQVIDQAYLDAKHADSQVFMSRLLANDGGLRARLAGLRRYSDAFHLRPGVEIVSRTPDGDMVVQGDLDLSGYRYAGVNPHTRQTTVYGSGEPGTLVVRAGGSLDIYGSVNDGFSPPPATPDDNGWVLTAGLSSFDGQVVVPQGGLTLATGTQFRPGVVLNYDVPLQASQLGKGVRLPVAATLEQTLTLSAGTVLSGDVFDATHALLYRAGTLLSQDVTLQPGATLGVGTVMPQSAAVQALLWPKGVPLPDNGFSANEGIMWKLAADTALPVGALIPTDTTVVLPGGVGSVALRAPAAGRQGGNWALAPMLPEGSQSWSMRWVSGADTAAADTRATQPAADAGSLRLADTHYSVRMANQLVPGTGTPGKYIWGPGAGEVGFEPGAPMDDYWVQLLTDWDAIGDPYYAEQIEPGKPAEYAPAPVPNAPALSVLRTGTGDLDLAAAGDFRFVSPYGIYTAGSPSAPLAAADGSDRYNQRRGHSGNKVAGSVLGPVNAEYESLVDGGSQYQAWYPEKGGNVLVRTGRNVLGDIMLRQQTQADPADPYNRLPSSTLSAGVGNWLWRQGGGSAADDVPTSWWINFGTYAVQTPYALDGAAAFQSGFVGIGTLGGGNLTLDVSGSLGTQDVLATRSEQNYGQGGVRSQGLVLAVGSTGRVAPGGALLLTGGGDLSVRVSGLTNPNVAASSIQSGYGVLDAPDINGVLVNLRGHARFDSGAIGAVDPLYKLVSNEIDALHPYDIRAFDAFEAGSANTSGGLVVMPGDATFSLNTRGDLVLSAAGDPGRVPINNAVPFTHNGSPFEGGLSWFSLWAPHTAIDLFSAGGNLTPISSLNQDIANIRASNYLPSDGRYVYPSILRAAAASGSLYYGNSLSQTDLPYGLLLAPSTSGEGQLELLARHSIYAGGMTISQSGAQPAAMATPFNPGFIGFSDWDVVARNESSEGILSRFTGGTQRYPLFAFGPNSAADGQVVSNPARFYAVDGDIVGLRTGAIFTFSSGPRVGQSWYEGGPVRIMAGRDIVNAGTPLGKAISGPQEIGNDGFASSSITSNLIVHGNPNDISLVSAGRDILYGNFNIAGPGLLEITAGRNLLQEDKAALNSIGPITTAINQDGSRAGGAGITVSAGMGAQGADYAGFAQRYLDAANQAQAGVPLADQPGKVAKTYESELSGWLAARFGFSGAADEALGYFLALPAEQQRVFLRQIYFAELKASGREYNDVSDSRWGSYLRGRQAIALLFPETDAQGRPRVYRGDVLIYGDAGIQSQFGGDIQVLTPGGAQTYGREGEAPPARLGTPGVITLGSGDIQMYALNSILLGQSRIMTTFGGAIQAWSAEGDINAGRGSKTSLVYTPPKREYDGWGNVTLSPQVPSTGAGIATLNPIPEVPPGDIDLIAPLGTIDAGEAGIRFSGNLNIAALQVVNAANILGQGKATGIPMTAAVNVGALTAASQAAGSAVQAVEQASRQAQRNQPSLISVEVLGYGNERLEAGGSDGAASAAVPVSYNYGSQVQVLGAGPLSPQSRRQLTPEEQRKLSL
ncbi:filamentous haemagglutinin family protein [Serratia entomophila]|uniref:filamentous haemagglutinin family protein n=1 Tax=Serratia entomophila TaxID=42906 RepID=UPI00217A5F65|nr:filamentous haemagglutinin family protein [Serratia entomophila]CAI1675762.1 Heme:hemopexin utilization protein A [Serratia entomophila]